MKDNLEQIYRGRYGAKLKGLSPRSSSKMNTAVMVEMHAEPHYAREERRIICIRWSSMGEGNESGEHR